MTTAYYKVDYRNSLLLKKTVRSESLKKPRCNIELPKILSNNKLTLYKFYSIQIKILKNQNKFSMSKNMKAFQPLINRKLKM